MFIGHFAPALIAAAHKDAPKLPVLMVAAQLVDWAFFGLLLFGAEKMRVTPGISAMNPMDLYHMPYTHSLLGALAFGGGTTVVIWALARVKGGGTTIVIWPRKAADGNGNVVVIWPRALVAGLIAGAVVVSHWFLDLLVHVPDLTITGSPPKLGFGLWNFPAIEMPLELLLTFGALWFCWKKLALPAGRVALLGGVMLALQIFNWFGPVEPEVTAGTSVMALAAYGLITLAAWWAVKAQIKGDSPL